MPLLRRCDANSGSNVRPATRVPVHRAANSEKEAMLTKQCRAAKRNISQNVRTLLRFARPPFTFWVMYRKNNSYVLR